MDHVPCPCPCPCPCPQSGEAAGRVSSSPWAPGGVSPSKDGLAAPSKLPAGAWGFVAALLLLAACSENQTFPMREPYRPGDPGPLDCVPNLDGRIDSEELAPALGVPVSLLVNPVGTTREVDLVGQVIDERRVWDQGADYADDQLARIEASELEGWWFADRFPGAEFVAPLDPAGQSVGVYVHDEAALFLLGVASASEDPPEGRTLLVYDDPIALYRFPMEPGASHVSASDIRDGVLRGLPYAGRDVYEVQVVSAGRLELPDLSFTQAMRVDVRTTVSPAAGAPVVQRQSSFLFECFGEVARATAPMGTDTLDFTTAAELRRFSLE